MTHGDDFVLAGPTESLTESKNKMTGVYSIKALSRRMHWGRRVMVYEHDPRHADVLVKGLRVEHVTSVQRMVRQKKSHSRWIRFSTASTGRRLHHVCSSASGHNIQCDRVMPKDVTSHSTAPCHVEEACQI